jgi:ATP-dependent Lhr-like helicase
VLALLRRRSLAKLRREIEPVEPAAMARFLPKWHGVGAGRGGIDRLAEVIAQLEGVPLPASVLERDVLPARVRSYSPRLLDELGAAGEVIWIGAGALGRDDGRIVLYRPDQLPLLLPPPSAADTPTTWIHVALREHLAGRGASFYRDLLAAVLRAQPEGERSPSERELLDALWDLVWSGEVTNDTFASLRALRWPRSDRRRRSPASAPRFRAASRLGPPEAAGRWSLVIEAVSTALALRGGDAASETERRHALALRLLERQGVVTRDGVAAENVAGGFSAVYPILREMEERGRVRRGYFVEGLGGAQFCLPAALDRLRAERGDPAGDDGPRHVLVLAAADPANPYGATLPWPRRDEEDRRPFQRAAGAYVVLVDGEPVIYLERGGKSLQTLPASEDPGRTQAALAGLSELVADGRFRSLQLERVDGEPIGQSALRDLMAEAGFKPAYRGWALRMAASEPYSAGG